MVFRIFAAWIAAFSLTAAAHADQVFNDRVIISDTLLCVGSSCTNGESPIASRQGLKINAISTAILFDDSTSPLNSNASRDWQINAKAEEQLRDLPQLTVEVLFYAAREAIRNAADRLGYSHRNIISGAGHDACWVNQVAPTAMVMCPCVDGLSHNEAEDISKEWSTAGAEVLFHAVVETAEIIG